MENMYNTIINYLKIYKNSNIALGELEKIVPGDTSYITFAQNVRRLIDDNILVEKSSKNNNGKEIPLAYKFGINKYELKKDYINEIQSYSVKLNQSIDLQKYLKLSEETWKQDLYYIDKISTYLDKDGFPKDYATSQERSFHIVGDEKWIDEKGGRLLLDRISLWEKLNIVNNSDPLMLAINPMRIVELKNSDLSEYSHLIVENKATFMALSEVIQETEFTSLIFGSGWKIVSNYKMLEQQLNLTGTHKLFYFGDLDNEGISIWSSLNEKAGASLATEFYIELLKKPCSPGKENQLRNDNAIKSFLSFFSEEDKNTILECLNSGRYLPQEALNKDELRKIWRNTK